MTYYRENLLTKIILETATLEDFRVIGPRENLVAFLQSPKIKALLSSFGLITSYQPGKFYIYENAHSQSYRYVITYKKGATPNWEVYIRGHTRLE